MKFRFFFLVSIWILFFVVQVSAYEETKITYQVGPVVDRWEYWNGQGEFIASNISDTYSLHLNGNHVISYATNAENVYIKPDTIEINASSQDNSLELLFYTPKPEGSGIFRANFSLPYVSEESIERNVRIEIENGSQVLYLNGPVFFEDDRFSTIGVQKIINLTTTEPEVSLMFLTKTTFNLVSVLVSSLLFSFVACVVLFFRRAYIISAIRETRHRFSPSWRFPVQCRSDGDGIGFSISLPKKRSESFGSDMIKYLQKTISRDKNGVHITIPSASRGSDSVPGMRQYLNEIFYRDEEGLHITIPSMLMTGCIILLLLYILLQVSDYISKGYQGLNSGLVFVVSIIIIIGILFVPKKAGTGLRHSLDKVVWKDEGKGHIVIPSVIGSVLFTLIFLVLIIWALQILNSYFKGMLFGIGAASSILSIGLLIFLGVLIGALVLSSRTQKDYALSVSVIVGGVILMGFFNIVGLLSIPVAVIAGVMMHWLLHHLFIN